MIGNDIVDLKLSKLQSNWQRRGYLSKIFSEEEREMISVSEAKDLLIWRMWSMKEASYKAHQRGFDLEPKFNPKSFCCSIISSEEGKVKTPFAEYFCSSMSDENYVYSEALMTGNEFHKLSAIRMDISSEDLKTEGLESLIKYLGKEAFPNLQFQKCRNGIPRTYSGNKELDTPFSITHHGKFSAYLIGIRI